MKQIKDPVEMVVTYIKTGEKKTFGPYERSFIANWIERCEREGSEGILGREIKEID